ncbi:MAG TPA: hypothetical protein VIZ90_20680 [Rhizobiaceae bacterium]
MRFFAAAAAAILLSAGMAFAQDNSTTGSTSGADTDPSNYLTGPNIHRFYQDDSMTELRPEAEVRTTWEAMSEQDRSNLRQACMGNKDNRYNPLCNSLKAM